MMYSVPIQRGYAYFQNQAPPLIRSIKPAPTNALGIPLESVTPLLPIGSIPLHSGLLPYGIICYPQNAHQARLVSEMPIPAETPESQQEAGLIEKVIGTIVSVLLIRGFLP